MHTLGKVMIWLTLLLAVAVVVLTGKFLDTRQKWMKDVADVRKQNEDNAKQLEQLRHDLLMTKNEYATLMLPWGEYADGKPVATAANFSPADPVYAVQTGLLELGLPDTPEKPVLHMFPPAGNGTIYAGPMATLSIQPNQIAFKPVWGARAEEIASWPAGNWRVRTMVPAVHVDHFKEIQKTIAAEQERLADAQKALGIQTDLVAKAQATLKGRQEELLGFENPPANADELDPEYSKGLVAALEIEEAARDKELAEVDRLRREVKSAYRTEQKLIERNSRLAGSLPGSQPAQPAETAKAAVSSR